MQTAVTIITKFFAFECADENQVLNRMLILELTIKLYLNVDSSRNLTCTCDARGIHLTKHQQVKSKNQRKQVSRRKNLE